MDVFIHDIETMVPPHAYAQSFAAERMRGWLADPKARRMASAIYGRSGIETRHSVLPDFLPGAEPALFREHADGRLDEPSTEARNRIFAAQSRTLSVETVRLLLARSPQVRERISHVVTVSCTGFYNPGPDFDIVHGLGLPESVERYHLGFMGCYAAFPALKMAEQFCRARPDSVVLVVCLELCSLHLRASGEPDALLANALFADGVAAVLVSAKEPDPARSAFALDGFHSALLPEGRGDMAWEIGDHGFNIRLSAYVPDIIGANISGHVARVLARAALGVEDVDLWAVHPGGRAILDKIQQALGLSADQLAASREVLRRYGNMSSATVLFVLKAMLDASTSGAARSVCAMAFGPGLTVESALLRLIPSARRATESPEEAPHALAPLR